MISSGDYNSGSIKAHMENKMKKEEGVNSVTELKKRWDDIIK